MKIRPTEFADTDSNLSPITLQIRKGIIELGIKPNTKDTPPEGNKFALLIGVDTFSDFNIPPLRGGDQGY